MSQCKECGADEDDVYLQKCPTCHEMICEEHKYVRSGRGFCGVGCSDTFFYSDEDEDADADE